MLTKIVKEKIEETLLSKKGLIISWTIIFVLYGLIFVLSNIKRLQEEKRLAQLPSPSPTPAEEIYTPSVYATDSAVLAIDEDLKNLEKELLETDLYEASLYPPVLDMKVEFKE